MITFLEIFQAVTSGVIEGLTEFIPVSSTAHLLIFSQLSNFKSVKNNLFEIFIQFGAILAICVIYRQKLIHVAKNIHKKESSNFVINLIISFLPAAIIGLLFHDFIKNTLFSLPIIAISLIIGGIIMIAVDSRSEKAETDSVDNITKKQALILGFFQTLAIIPGTSRSGATIIGGLLLNLSRKTATEFSFFMSIIVISAASFYDLYKNFEFLDFSDFYLISLGFVSSFLSALIVIKWFILYVSKNNFMVFAIYRIILGSLILFYIF